MQRRIFFFFGSIQRVSGVQGCFGHHWLKLYGQNIFWNDVITEFPLFYPLGVYKSLLGWQLSLSPLERWNTRSKCNVTVIFLYLSDLLQNLPFYWVTLKQTVYSRPAMRQSVFLCLPISLGNTAKAKVSDLAREQCSRKLGSHLKEKYESKSRKFISRNDIQLRYC